MTSTKQSKIPGIDNVKNYFAGSNPGNRPDWTPEGIEKILNAAGNSHRVRHQRTEKSESDAVNVEKKKEKLG